jgi:hypothetical protein
MREHINNKIYSCPRPAPDSHPRPTGSMTSPVPPIPSAMLISPLAAGRDPTDITLPAVGGPGGCGLGQGRRG